MWKKLRANFGFWIIAGYLTIFFGHLSWQTFSGASEKRERRGFYLQHALRVSKPLLREDRARDLSRYLKESVEMGMIDSFELELMGKPIERGGQAPDTRPVLVEPVSEVNGWVWGKAETADVSLRLGSGTGWRARLSQALRVEAIRLPADFAFLVLALFLSTVFQGRMRLQARKNASVVLRDGRRAKVLRIEKAPVPHEALSGEGIFGRVILMNAERTLALESFFAGCTALVVRYGASVISLHGHELLFVFLNGDPKRQTRLALALVRDLEKIATASGGNFSSALSFGLLDSTQVLAKDNAVSFFGAPVQETADILRTRVSEKVSALKLSPSIKHLSSELECGLDEMIANCKLGKISELSYHRSDSSVAAILGALTTQDWNREAYLATINELRQVRIHNCGIEIVEAFRALLEAELSRKDSYRLSGVLALAPHLLAKNLVDKELEKKFLEAVKIRDRRVRANAVEIFTKFFPERVIPELRALVRDEDNRVSANALIKVACERFDENVIARIEERVKCGSVAHVASALHAMGEIADYYKRTDPVFLNTKITFIRLFDRLPAIAQHPNSMIRRQALMAARKLDSPMLNESLQHLFFETSDPELLALFANVYGWKRVASVLSAA